MTRDEAVGAIRDAVDAMTEQFSDNPDRVAQMTAHAATTIMAIEHMHEERERGPARSTRAGFSDALWASLTPEQRSAIERGADQ